MKNAASRLTGFYDFLFLAHKKSFTQPDRIKIHHDLCTPSLLYILEARKDRGAHADDDIGDEAGDGQKE